MIYDLQILRLGLHLQRGRLEPFLFSCNTRFSCPNLDQHTFSEKAHPSYMSVLATLNFKSDQIAALLDIRAQFSQDIERVRAERKHIQFQMREVRALHPPLMLVFSSQNNSSECVCFPASGENLKR